MEKLGVGYCSRELMKGHIAIPIHSVHGELLAYARCPIADKKEGGGYKYPDRFHKELEVYNLHRAVRALRTNGLGLIMVEDFFDLFRLYEAGYENVIAPMGGGISDT
jgi:hypothetical protein